MFFVAKFFVQVSKTTQNESGKEWILDKIPTNMILDFDHFIDLKLSCRKDFRTDEKPLKRAFNQRKNCFCTIILGLRGDQNPK